MKIPTLVFGPVCAVLVMVGACARQSEGDRCDLRAGSSGNDDCTSPLICTSVEKLDSNQVGAGLPRDEGRCCPADRSTVTSGVCQQISPGFGGLDSGTPANIGVDSGNVDSAVGDANAADVGKDVTTD